MSKLIYLCSPFSAVTKEHRQVNIDYASSIISNFVNTVNPEYAVLVSPLPLLGHAYGVIEEEVAMEYCFNLLSQCDALYMPLPVITMNMSKEILFAEKLEVWHYEETGDPYKTTGIPVFSTIEEMYDFCQLSKKVCRVVE